MVIDDLFAAVFTVNVHIDHSGIERAWAVQRTHGDDVFNIGRSQLGQIFFHAGTFKLEYSGGMGIL